MPRLFVYGTLKRGDVRDRLLAEELFLGAARTRPAYRLHDCGAYPALVDAAPAGNSILGEVYDVSPHCLSRLDEEEGVPEGLYARRPIELLDPFANQRIEAYFYLPATDDLPDLGDGWRPIA
ncbi:MAG: gamma-glutamylcyclotransferase family protein [Planctomycetaceae bacterium]